MLLNSLKFEMAFVQVGGECWYLVSSVRTGSIQTIQADNSGAIDREEHQK